MRDRDLNLGFWVQGQRSNPLCAPAEKCSDFAPHLYFTDEEINSATLANKVCAFGTNVWLQVEPEWFSFPIARSLPCQQHIITSTLILQIPWAALMWGGELPNEADIFHLKSQDLSPCGRRLPSALPSHDLTHLCHSFYSQPLHPSPAPPNHMTEDMSAGRLGLLFVSQCPFDLGTLPRINCCSPSLLRASCPPGAAEAAQSQAQLSKCNSEPCQPEDAEAGMTARGSSSARGEELFKWVECESARRMRSGEEVENEQSLLLSTPKQRGNCLMRF